MDRRLVIAVVRLGGNIGHCPKAGIDFSATGVPDRFILLHNRQMRLVVLLPILSVIQQEFCQLHVTIAFAAAFDVVHEAAEAHQRLLHLLVPVVPGLFGRGADGGDPAVSQLLGRVIQAAVFAIGGHGNRAMADFQKIPGHVPFVSSLLSGSIAVAPRSRCRFFAPCSSVKRVCKYPSGSWAARMIGIH